MDSLTEATEASVRFAGAAPALISGVNQINAQVPNDAQAGDAIPISISIGAVHVASMSVGSKVAIR